MLAGLFDSCRKARKATAEERARDLLRARNDARFAEEWRQAEAWRGKWVATRDMPPAINVVGRIYRSPDGTLHRFGYGTSGTSRPHVEAWFVPDA